MVVFRGLGLLVALTALTGCKAAPGKSCFDEGSAACDGSRMLTCRAKTWEEVACAGPKGCTQSGRFVDCDETVAVAGTPCSNDSPDGYSSCSVDHKTRLKCAFGAWHEDIPCRGPKGCAVVSRFVDCDDSVAKVGDACERDSITCSDDASAVLVCRTGRYALDTPCSPGRCTVSGSTVGCE